MTCRYFANAVGEYWYGFHGMQTQHLRRDNPCLQEGRTLPEEQHAKETERENPVTWHWAELPGSHLLLLPPSHPTQRPEGRRCCVGDTRDKSFLQLDSRLKLPKSENYCQRTGWWSDIQYQLNLAFISELKRHQVALLPSRTVCSQILKLTGEG